MKTQSTRHSNHQSWFPNFSQWLTRALSLSGAVTLGFPQRTPLTNEYKLQPQQTPQFDIMGNAPSIINYISGSDSIGQVTHPNYAALASTENVFSAQDDASSVAHQHNNLLYSTETVNRFNRYSGIDFFTALILTNAALAKQSNHPGFSLAASLSACAWGLSNLLGVNAQGPASMPAKVFNVDAIPSNQKVIFTGAVNTENTATTPNGLMPFEIGDINRDGRRDFAFAERVDPIPMGSANSTQTIYLVYGADFAETVDLTKLSLSQGITLIRHVAPRSQARLLPLANAGDVSGDGFDDIVIDGDVIDGGSRNANNATRHIYWIAGGTITESVIDVDNSPLVNLIKLIGTQDMGLTVSMVGDIDQNGKNDILYCTYFGPQLIFMGVAPNTIFLNNATLPEVAKFPLDPTGTLGQYSTTTTGSPAGDANGDGIPDFFVVLNSQPGTANVIFGRKFDRSVPLLNMTMADGRIIYAGTSSNPSPVYNEKNPLVFIPGNVLPAFSQNYYSPAGEVNRDRYADYMIGDPFFILPKTPQALTQSRTSLIFGSNSTNTLYLDELTPEQGISIIGLPTQQGSATYATGSAGDVNKDGYGDIYHSIVTNMSTLHIFILFGGKLSGTVNLNALTAEQGIVFTRNATGLGGNPEFYASALRNVSNNGYGSILIPHSRLNNNLGGINCNAAILLKGEVITSLASGTQQQPTTGQQTSSAMGQTDATSSETFIITSGSGNTAATTGVTSTSKNATMSATSDMSNPTSSVTSSTTAATTTTTAKTTINAAASQFSGFDFIFTFLLINMAARLSSDLPFFVNLLAGLGAGAGISNSNERIAQVKMPIHHDTVVAATQRGVFRAAKRDSSANNSVRAALTIVASDRDMNKVTSLMK